MREHENYWPASRMARWSSSQSAHVADAGPFRSLHSEVVAQLPPTGRGIAMTTQAPTRAGATSPSSLLRLLDRLVTRLVRLPPPTTAYTITRDLRIPMRDGVELLADMYTPTAPPYGTLLVRSPYGYPAVMVAGMGTIYGAAGIASCSAGVAARSGRAASSSR